MQTRKAIICWLVILVVAFMIPIQQAAGYFAEDSFATCWKEGSGELPKESRSIDSYTVRPGDTLWSISRRFGVDLKELTAVNGIQEGTVIIPGQVLALAEATVRTHRVSRGETMWSLARQYQVSMGQLMAANRIQDPSTLMAGQELIIASSADQVQSVLGKVPELTFAWPLVGRITSNYGPRNGEFHHGLDIAGNYGELIKASEKGSVVWVGWRPFYGNTVILDHGDNYRTVYGHISDYLVKNGDVVEKGQVIARVGSTGRSTGPHLHFEVRINNKTVNPISFLKY